MKEYVAYVVKIGNGYLAKVHNASILSASKYKITLHVRDAFWFSKEYVFDTDKRYGGQAVGLLPVLLEDEA
ncbi:hypothetical protein [Leuconostoc lactis]|uniref:hypothetical protein n=1 Tax=Leuconostoc lactis TaxID=1246 RepID=UPI00351E4BB2